MAGKALNAQIVGALGRGATKEREREREKKKTKERERERITIPTNPNSDILRSRPN